MAIIDRIKYSPDKNSDWLTYKYPGEEFVLGTQLIVGEGQIAILYKGGKVEGVFEPGTHTLDTYNIPFLKGITKLPFGGKTPFTAEVYYINKTNKLDLYWGTRDPIQVIDPKYRIKLRVRAFGQFGIRVTDYPKFLTEIIGTLSDKGLRDN